MRISSNKKSKGQKVEAARSAAITSLIQDPDIQLGRSDSWGIQSVYYKGEHIGFLDAKKNELQVDTDRYDKIPAAVCSSVKVKKGAAKNKKPKAKGKTKKVKSTVKYESLEELEDAIKEALDDEVCTDIVQLAYSEDGIFEGDYFIPEEDFFESVIANYEAKDIALKFFNGEDLDSKGPANPNRDYFRFDGAENIESTDYPGDIYMDKLDIEIVDYIMEHLEDREYPEKIQKLIDAYLGNMEE